MPYAFPDDIHASIQSFLSSGEYRSEEEVLRRALANLSEREDDRKAIAQAIEQWQAGDDGIPLNEAFTKIRDKHANPGAA